MATVKFYLSRYIKKDDERGEIQFRFSGNRNFVKRAATGIFITAGNWDSEKGMPKGKKANKYGDDCEEIRDRLNLLTSYLIRCWEQTKENELEPDSLTQWMNDIEWKNATEPIFINGRESTVTRWEIASKARMKEEKVIQKAESAKTENRYFLQLLHRGTIQKRRYRGQQTQDLLHLLWPLG